MGLHARYTRILGDNPQLLLDKKTEQKIEEYRKVLTPLFTDMMSAVFKQKGAQLDINIIASPQAQALIGAHAGILDSSFKQVEMSEAMRRRLSRSNHIFSGMKVVHELNEGHLSLLDENGNRKPFERFLNDVRKIDTTYNKNYLQAEYQFIHSSAIMAAKWEEFSKTGDRYLLRYRTVGDNRVRPAHAALHGVTLPMSDPFWEQHYPPNGWRCRCDVVQVRRGKYPVTDHDEAMARGEEAMGTDSGMFRFNPGIEKKTVPDYNPYTLRRCRDCDIAKGKTTLAFVPDNELCAACKLVRQCESRRFQTKKEYPNGGSVQVHQLVNPKDSDYDRLISVADFFAKQGMIAQLTPKMSRPQKFVYQNIYYSLMGTKFEGKCPDLLINGKWYEHEGFTTDKPKKAFRNMLNDGLKQSDRLIIDKPELTETYMKRVIRQRVKDGQTITEVWIKDGDKLQLLYKKLEE